MMNWQVKDWWNRNGKPLLTGALLAGVVVLGWNTWHKYQNNQSQRCLAAVPGLAGDQPDADWPA